MPERPAKKVLLIGWDAADWQIIDPLLARGEMPALKAFLGRGVRSSIATLHPIISPILWNSIATGKRADKHDILGFLEPDGHGYVRPVSSTSRKAKALWNILSQHGLKSNVVGWFASYPAEPIDGVIVTDRFRQGPGQAAEALPLDERSVHPPALLDTLRDLAVTIEDIAGEQAEYFVPLLRTLEDQRSPLLEALALLLAQCASVHNAATWLMEHEPWDFMGVYYDTIDHFGHAFMEFRPPRMAHVSDEDARAFGGVMDACYRFHDLLLARLLHLAGDDATVIILSDHGFHSGALRPRVFFDSNGKKVGPGANPVAWHRPQGVLAAAGPGIKRAQTIYGTSLLDVCPTILTLLGVPVGRDMDGSVITHMFEATPHVETVPTHEAPHERDGVHRGAAVDDPYAASEVLRQLAELGYIEEPTGDKEQMLAAVLRDRKFALAQVHETCGRAAEAERLLRELYQQDPAPDRRARLAANLAAQGKVGEAEELLAAVPDDPGMHPLATALRAQIQYARADFAGAEARLLKLLELGVRLPGLNLQLGKVRLKRGDWAGAAEAFGKAVEADLDDAEAHDGLGVALRVQGRLEDAVYHHMRSIALVHDRADTHVHLGMALASLRRTEWALKAFQTAAELAPRSPFPHRCLAQVYRKLVGDEARAREHVRRALELRSAQMRRATDELVSRGSWT